MKIVEGVIIIYCSKLEITPLRCKHINTYSKDIVTYKVSRKSERFN